MAALTATATERVRTDIAGWLELDDPLVQVSGFDRPNLRLAVHELTPANRVRWIVDFVRRHPSDCGIIYAMTRRRVDELFAALEAEGFSVAAYHAGYDNEDRAAAQERFARDEARVMVATNAFGMGIDKSNVRYVINDGMPLSLEEYYQEAGRAGRDGDEAQCHLLWSKGDIRTAHYLIDNTEVAPEATQQEADAMRERRERLLGSMIGYAMSTSCLRERILRYFGQRHKAGQAGCGACSVCGWRGDTVPMVGEVRRSRLVPEDGSQEFFDRDLFEELRVVRRSLADEAGLRPYMVFSDATLRAMATSKPQTEKELLSINGIGQVKLARYGEDFLKVLTDRP